MGRLCLFQPARLGQDTADVDMSAGFVGHRVDRSPIPGDRSLVLAPGPVQMAHLGKGNPELVERALRDRLLEGMFRLGVAGQIDQGLPQNLPGRPAVGILAKEFVRRATVKAGRSALYAARRWLQRALTISFSFIEIHSSKD